MAGSGTGVGVGGAAALGRRSVAQVMRGCEAGGPYSGIRMHGRTPELQRGLGVKSPEKGARVGQVQPGSPADKAGVLPGDVILNVDGASTDGWTTSDAVKKIRGPAGTTVTITVRNLAGTTAAITIVRATVALHTVFVQEAP